MLYVNVSCPCPEDNINDETCELLEPYLRFDEARARPVLLGTPLGAFIFSLMASIGDPIYAYLSKGFRG